MAKFISFHNAFVAIVSIMALLFLVPTCMTIIRNGHSVSDDLYQMFVYTTCTLFWWKWFIGKPLLINFK